LTGTLLTSRGSISTIPAEPVRLVRVLRRVEALVVLVPAVAGRVALAQAPALLVRARRVGPLK
jgi:hypothetical protein